MSILTHWDEKAVSFQSHEPRTRPAERSRRDTVKRVVQVVLLFAGLAAVLAVTIAIRLLIWLPMWLAK